MYATTDGAVCVGEKSLVCVRNNKGNVYLMEPIRNSREWWDFVNRKREKAASTSVQIDVAMTTCNSDDKPATLEYFRIKNEACDQSPGKHSKEHEYRSPGLKQVTAGSSTVSGNTARVKRAATASNTTSVQQWLHKIILEEESPCHHGFTKEHYNTLLARLLHKKFGDGNDKYCFQFWELTAGSPTAWPQIADLGNWTAEIANKDWGTKLPGKGRYPPELIFENNVPQLMSFDQTKVDNSELGGAAHLAASSLEGAKFLGQSFVDARLVSEREQHQSALFRVSKGADDDKFYVDVPMSELWDQKSNTKKSFMDLISQIQDNKDDKSSRLFRLSTADNTSINLGKKEAFFSINTDFCSFEVAKSNLKTTYLFDCVKMFNVSQQDAGPLKKSHIPLKWCVREVEQVDPDEEAEELVFD
jgi:hypothetical protein